MTNLTYKLVITVLVLMLAIYGFSFIGEQIKEFNQTTVRQIERVR